MKKDIFPIVILLIVCVCCKINAKDGNSMQTVNNSNADYDKTANIANVRAFLENHGLDSLEQVGKLVDYLYLNDEWIEGANLSMLPIESISNIEIKNDEYDNRCVFVNLSPHTVDYIENVIDEESRKLGIFCPNLDPSWEFPGGMGKMMEWEKENIRIPKGFKGQARVVVSFAIQPDGTVTDAKIVKGNENEELNREALRLISTLPKAPVHYYTPKRDPVHYTFPVKFEKVDSLP